MAESSGKSPYLATPNRLTDVLAAIQAMGSYRFYKLDFETWADRITGDTSRASYWKDIFVDHPEFFRLDRDKQKASLVWRRQSPKRYDVDQQRELTRAEFYALTDEQKGRVSRIPLKPDDIHALMESAINLHSRALEQQKDSRWWIPLVASGLGGLLGAVLGAALGK